MNSQYPHAVLPNTTHDEEARQGYYMDIRRFLATNVAPGNKIMYNKKIKSTRYLTSPLTAA